MTPKMSQIVEPIAQFKERITKKYFGTYVTPQNSPIQPEKFKGFHTGVDVEYQDISVDVPVYAIADGTILTARFASGYGGLVVVRHLINSQTYYVIYGHLRPTSLPKPNTIIKRGEQLGLLGTGYSSETDGERRHLHFGVATSNTILGYVNSKTELDKTWIDPLSLYN